MSGVEGAAGLALALLPVFVSATEHYDDCLQIFARYKNFAEEVRRYLQLLGIQRSIFRGLCRLLLHRVSSEHASNMMGQTNHPSWSDEKLEYSLAEILGESRDDCITVVNIMQDELRKMEDESQDLLAAAKGNSKGTSSSSGEAKTRKRIATKLGFSISSSRLESKIIALRSLNSDFQLLSSNIIKATQFAQTTTPARERESLKAVEIYRTIGHASQRMYEALGNACTKHNDHLAHVRVEAEQIGRLGDGFPPVKFSLAFANPASRSDLTWFVVDTIVIVSDVPEVKTLETEVLTNSLKRTLNNHEDQEARKPKKNVRLESSVRVGYLPVMIANPFSLQNTLYPDFCDFLRRCSGQKLEPDVCIATLETSHCSKSYVFPYPFKGHWKSEKAISLREMVSNSSFRRAMARSTLFERVRLARLLAVAILRYHRTPWIPREWGSNDVLFFPQADGGPSSAIDLTAPHLNSRIRKQCPPPPAIDASGARNMSLFNLGIIFLEIAYSSPWNALRQSHRSSEEPENLVTEFQQARRLAMSGCSGMGTDYDRIVEQLIECDFACGADLSKESLQAAVHRDVICLLETLEKGLQKLHLGT